MSQFFLVLTVIIGLGGPLWLAQIAPPLGSRPFRWGSWVSIQTALVSGGAIATAFLLVASRGVQSLAFVLMAVGGLGFASAIMLYQRTRLGAVLTIAGEATFLVAALAFTPGSLSSPLLSLTPTLVLAPMMLINVVYFRKRWALLTPWHDAPSEDKKGSGKRRVRRGVLVVPRLKARQLR